VSLTPRRTRAGVAVVGVAIQQSCGSGRDGRRCSRLRPQATAPTPALPQAQGPDAGPCRAAWRAAHTLSFSTRTRTATTRGSRSCRQLRCVAGDAAPRRCGAHADVLLVCLCNAAGVPLRMGAAARQPGGGRSCRRVRGERVGRLQGSVRAGAARRLSLRHKGQEYAACRVRRHRLFVASPGLRRPADVWFGCAGRSALCSVTMRLATLCRWTSAPPLPN
jgi:hypothetical protein